MFEFPDLEIMEHKKFKKFVKKILIFGIIRRENTLVIDLKATSGVDIVHVTDFGRKQNSETWSGTGFHVSNSRWKFCHCDGHIFTIYSILLFRFS